MTLIEATELTGTTHIWLWGTWPPRHELDEAIADIWGQVLDVDEVDIHHDFFAAGGHSLLAAELCRRLNDRFGWTLRVIEIFAHPTAARLSDHGGMSDV